MTNPKTRSGSAGLAEHDPEDEEAERDDGVVPGDREEQKRARGDAGGDDHLRRGVRRFLRPPVPTDNGQEAAGPVEP